MDPKVATQNVRFSLYVVRSMYIWISTSTFEFPVYKRRQPLLRQQLTINDSFKNI